MRLIDADELIIFDYGGIKFVPQEFINAAPTVKPQPKWLSVKDKLPDLHDECFEEAHYQASDPVLVWSDQIRIACYEIDDPDDVYEGMIGWVTEDGTIINGVTHWMTMPGKPEDIEQ